MKEYISELKNYDFYTQFKPGYYLDALDQHKWKVGQIKQITKYGLRTTIEVHFDGYSARYDSGYDLPSSHKLAPFRTHTLPYTGLQNGIEPKRQQPPQKLSHYLKEFSKFTNEKNLQKIKATYINQFIRGEIFIVADYLITKRNLDKDFDEANQFIMGYIKEGCKIILLSVEFLKEFQKQQTYDQNLFNVHPKIALIESNTEFLFILTSILGNKDQRAEIQRNYQKFGTSTSIAKIKQYLIDAKINIALEKMMNFKTANGRGLPWSIKKEICLLLNFLTEGYVFPVPLDHKQIFEVLDYMSYFSLKGLLPKQQQQRKTLKLIISLIIGGNFQGRLRGLYQLKKILEYYLRKRDYVLAEVQQADILSFLIDNKNFNPQIFKRSLPLFAYCCRNSLLTKKQLTQIISLHKDKHELQIKGFYSSLAEFPTFLEPEVVIVFFKQIVSTVPLNEFSINLVKDYTLCAINKNSAFKHSNCREGWELGLTYYWNLITSQKYQLPLQLKNKTIECFATIMGDLYYSKEVEKYISLSIKGIANRKNLQFYFKVIHEIIKLSKGTRISRSIEIAQKQFSIVDCVIDGLKNTQSISDKMWECMFQFLEEVTYVSRKKVTFLQLRQFWKIKQCRLYLLKMLRKYRFKNQNDKSQQKIIFKQLPPQVIKQLIDKIFLDPKQMEDYSSISMDLYQTVDQLIMCFNHTLNYLEYNYKHTIRLKNIDKVVGSQFYINLINNCKQKDIVEKAIHRFAEIFMRVPESKNQQTVKLYNWNYLLEKFSKLKRNVLLSYQIMISDINGRMKSLNILEPDPVHLIILNKTTGVKKLLIVPRYTSLWKLRHQIGEQFKLQALNFDMLILGSNQFKETNFEKQQDFSMALISPSKDGPSVCIYQTKNKHPHLQSIEQFYKTISESKGDQLYQWLGKQQGNQILQILSKLPFIKKIQQKIIKLSFKDMNQIIDSNSMYRLSYQLKIIGSDKNLKFSMNMIEKGFIPYISKIFLNKRNYMCPEYYKILTNLIIFMNELVKISKNVKNAPNINDNFLVQLLHYNQNQSVEYLTYISKCILFLRDLSMNKQILSITKIRPVIFFETKQIEKILENIILSKNTEKVSQYLVQFSKNTKSQTILLQISNHSLNSDTLYKRQQSCRHLFEILSLLLDKNIPKDIIDSFKKVIRTVRRQKIMEETEQNQNELLKGTMNFLLKIIKNKPTIQQIQDIIGEKIESFINYITKQCLFNLEEPNLIRFKSIGLRQLGFSFINCFEYSAVGKQISSIISQAMKQGGSWRRQDQWNISAIKQIHHSFTGLKNLAATCYINSLLQQLFFIEQFRDQIISVEAESIEDKENIVLELQNIFAHLKYSQSPIYTTLSLCKKFILDGQPIDPRVQTDVDQFFHSLMDKLERNLGKINKKSIINNIFGGQLSNLIIGSKCEHTSERIQPFLSIRLEIKDKKSLEDALKEFIKGEVLEGDNAYFCERCDAKVKAVKRVCLKTLPQILIVTLKRFEFDYESMQKFKLNTYCSFPDKINVLPYTRDGIDNDHEFDNSLYEYKLKGVVIHYGVSQAGHYTSYIKTESEKWHYFDDQKISEFNFDEIGAQSFGGIEENPFGDDEEKKKNAYLLFYQKIKKTSPKISLDLSEASIIKEIKQQNTRNKLVNLLFQPNMQNYLLGIGNNKQDPKLFLLYFHIVFLRSAKKRQRIQQFYSCAQSLLQSKQLSAWYLNQINQSFLHEFIFFAQLQIKGIITGLIVAAFKANIILQAGISVLEQLAAFIGKKHLYPTIQSVFKSACKINKQYEKFLISINSHDVILQAIRGNLKESKISKPELKVKTNENQFGYAKCTYYERPMVDQIDLVQCLECFKINLVFQDFQPLIKKARRNKTQQSLAYVFVKRYPEPDSFVKFQQYICARLCTLQCGIQDDYIFNFYINLVQQYALLKDQFKSKRIQRLVIVYLKALKDSIMGYKSELLLLLGLFRICAGNMEFRDRVSYEFQEKDGKKLLKDIKSWVKDVGMNLNNLVRTDRLGLWRRPRDLTLTTQSFNLYFENEDKINSDKFLSSLNAIVERHNTFLSTGEQKLIKDETVKWMREKYKFVRQYGLVAQLQINDRIKIVLAEEISKMDYF